MLFHIRCSVNKIQLCGCDSTSTETPPYLMTETIEEVLKLIHKTLQILNFELYDTIYKL